MGAVKAAKIGAKKYPTTKKTGENAPMTEIRLNDRVVIMTGASRGLGRAMAVGMLK